MQLNWTILFPLKNNRATQLIGWANKELPLKTFNYIHYLTKDEIYSIQGCIQYYENMLVYLELPDKYNFNEYPTEPSWSESHLEVQSIFVYLS